MGIIYAEVACFWIWRCAECVECLSFACVQSLQFLLHFIRSSVINKLDICISYYVRLVVSDVSCVCDKLSVSTYR